MCECSGEEGKEEKGASQNQMKPAVPESSKLLQVNGMSVERWF